MIGLSFVGLIITLTAATALCRTRRAEQDRERARAVLRPGHDPHITPRERQQAIADLNAAYRAPAAKHRYAR